MKTMECPAAGKERNHCAFTRMDLLGVLFIVAILAVLLMPALAGTHVNTQGTKCLNNLRRITQGWWMYANDSQGKLVPNRGLFPPNPDGGGASWVAGDMRVNGPIGSPYTGTDATNSALLVDPNYSYLAPYVQDPVLYKCPVDQSTWSVIGLPGSKEMPRVRSYSMSQAIGCATNGTLVSGNGEVIGHWLSSGNASAPGGFPFREYSKESDLEAPSPSQLILILDEHPNSINDTAFAFAMPQIPTATYWVDTPAAYHNNGCNFSFADGHVEFHEWREPQVIPPVVWQADSPNAPNLGNIPHSAPADPDILWLAHRISALAPGAMHVYQP